MSTYLAICQLESFTGGDGDGDSDTQARIDCARTHGRAVGALSAKVYDEWAENDWISLFRTQYTF